MNTVRWRSQKYLDWVRKQPCCVCEFPEAEAHHIKGVGNFSGAGLKADDILAIPLCMACHRFIHQNPEKFDQCEMVCRTVVQAVRQGVLK
jgi:hypothetical protein